MNQTINDLLTEFDKMGFAPTNVCDNPERKAKLWKSALVYELGLLLDEHAAIRKKEVEEFAEKLKAKVLDKTCINKDFNINISDIYKMIEETLKEYEK
jgi:hypothetical protein